MENLGGTGRKKLGSAEGGSHVWDSRNGVWFHSLIDHINYRDDTVGLPLAEVYCQTITESSYLQPRFLIR